LAQLEERHLARESLEWALHRGQFAHVFAQPCPVQPLQLAGIAYQEDAGVEPLKQSEVTLTYCQVGW